MQFLTPFRSAALGLLAGSALTAGIVSAQADDTVQTEAAAATTYQAGAAGTVTVDQADDGTLTVIDVTPASGWSCETEQATGLEVEVTCENGTDRVDFNAESEDGEVRVRVRD